MAIVIASKGAFDVCAILCIAASSWNPLQDIEDLVNVSCLFLWLLWQTQFKGESGYMQKLKRKQYISTCLRSLGGVGKARHYVSKGITKEKVRNNGPLQVRCSDIPQSTKRRRGSRWNPKTRSTFQSWKIHKESRRGRKKTIIKRGFEDNMRRSEK